MESDRSPRFQPGKIKNDAPVVASFCTTFLKPEMQQIYRQLTALRRYRPIILTHRRTNELIFPFPDVKLLGRPLTHPIRRFWSRSICNLPIQAYGLEASHIYSEISKMDAKLLHIYSGSAALYLLPLLRRKKIPAVVSFHGADAGSEGSNKAMRKYYEEVFDLADLVIARSQSMLGSLETLGCPPDKLRLHRAGVSLSLNVPIVRTPPVEGDFRFMQACRLVERKGIDLAIRAFAIFAKEFPMAELIIAGEGPLKKRLISLTAELGLKERVHLPGFLPQKTLHELYERSHIFVQAGLAGGIDEHEGVPDALLEAMATGMPVIGTPIACLREAVKDRKSGLMVPEKDVSALAGAFLRLGRDGMLLQELSQGAVSLVREKFDRQKQARVLEDIYDEAIRISPSGN